jgi:hypothetical protein
MADDTLITKALEQIAFHDSESLRLKRWVNDADTMLGNEPRFGDLAAATHAPLPMINKSATKAWAPGAFFNKPFSTAVKMILVGRYEAAGNEPSPASVDEIHTSLTEGSFDFETTGVDAQKNSIRISLGKNSASFVRLPNSELFGLLEWYGKKAGKPGRKAAAADAVPLEVPTMPEEQGMPFTDLDDGGKAAA